MKQFVTEYTNIGNITLANYLSKITYAGGKITSITPTLTKKVANTHQLSDWTTTIEEAVIVYESQAMLIL